MNKNKGDAGHIAGLINLENQLTTMNDFTTTNQKSQIMFDFGNRPKTLEIINCFGCNQSRELDGYRFKLVPICVDCRTERDVEITNNRFERRQQR
jgi:hypothetical protein